MVNAFNYLPFHGPYLFLCPEAATVAFPHNQKGERWE
jgi:hypothetical protein